MIKGVVLAGGLGTRLDPITRVVNKHLLDVFDEPMVFYPIRTLRDAGVTEITVVTGEYIDQFERLLGDGAELGVRLSFAQQEGEGGIADALAKAEPTVQGSPVAVILGDNIFQENLTPFVSAYAAQDGGARILLKELALDDAKRFGVAEVDGDRIGRIVEKPSEPRSRLAVTGFYMYDEQVFDLIRTLPTSARSELEVTDLNNLYIDAGTMRFDVLRGWWTDAGTPASKLKASILVALDKGVTFHA